MLKITVYVNGCHLQPAYGKKMTYEKVKQTLLVRKIWPDKPERDEKENAEQSILVQAVQV